MKNTGKMMLTALLACLLAAMLLPAVFAGAAEPPEVVASGYCGAGEDGMNVAWTLDSAGALSITGTGAMADFGSEDAPWAADRDSILSVSVGDGVTGIGANAFYYCGALASVDLPDSLTAIGSLAFYHCTALPAVTLPEGLTELGRSSFAYCSALAGTVRLPGVTQINDSAFFNCDALEGVELSDRLVSIGHASFSGCRALAALNLPEGFESIGDCAFTYCESLTTLDLPDSLTYFGWDSFGACTGLISAEVPPQITELNGNQFHGCTALESVTLPEGLQKLGAGVFGSCTFLSAITIPASVTSISVSTFGNVFVMNDFRVAPGNAKYAAVDNCLIDKQTKTLVKAFSGCVLPDDGSIRRIGESAFAGRPDPVAVVLPDGVQEICAHAFEGSGVTAVVLPDSVTAVREYAFADCPALASVRFSASLTTLEKLTCHNCPQLTSITASPAGVRFTAVGNCLIDGSTHTLALGCAASEIPNDGSVTAIGGWAFCHVEGMDTVELPDGLVSIGECAFFETKLTSIDLPDGLTTVGMKAFYNCQSLRRIRFPHSLTQLGRYAFDLNRQCYFWYDGLYEEFFEIPNYPKYNVLLCALGGKCGDDAVWSYADGVITVSGTGPTYDYRNMIPDTTPWFAYRQFADTVVVEEGITGLGKHSFASFELVRSVTLPQSLTLIDDYAFVNTLALTAVDLPDGITRIGEGAFSGSALTSVALPAGLTAIEYRAFHGCGSLADVTIPEGVTVIGEQAFCRCAMESLVLPDSVAVLEKTCFLNCEQLKTVTLSEGLTTIGEYCFAGCGLTRADLPASVTSIGNYAFGSCGALTAVTMGDRVSEIGRGVFNECRSLSEVTLSAGLTAIPENLFYHCDALPAVTVPENVTRIGESAFRYCDALTEITLPAALTRVERLAFYEANSLQNVFFGGTGEQWANIPYDGGNGALFTAHIHYESVWHTPGAPVCTVVAAATCTGPGAGEEAVTCVYCDYEFSRTPVTLPALGHGHTLGLDVSGAPSTCTLQGYTMTVCLDCGEVVASGILPPDPDAHVWGEWTVVTPATYLNAGLERRDCAACGAAETRVVPTLIPEETFTDPDSGIALQTQAGVLPENTAFKVDDVFDGTYFRLLNREVGSVESTLYNITPFADGERVQPDGMVLVRLPLPAGYDPANVDIYYISTETNTIERMNSYVEDGYICFETNHFSVYAIVAPAQEAPAAGETPAPGNGGSLPFFAKIMAFFRNIAEWFKKLFVR